MNILYAEDSPDIARTVKLVLEADGHQVTHVNNGEEALAAYSTDLPDLILMDVIMPVMNGIDAVRRIKNITVSRWVPIIMMSGLDANEDMIKGLDAGADEYIFKPIDFQVLIARIRSKQRTIDIQNRLIGILDNVHDGIITINPNGMIGSFNKAAERVFGYNAVEVLEKNVNMLMPEPYKSQHDDYLKQYLATQHAKIIGIGRKVQGLRKSGEIFPMHLAVTRINSAFGMQFIGVVRDISKEEEDRQQIEHLALHDQLTGLPNRASFDHFFTELVKRGKPFTLLYVDIDGFKPVNDKYGHKTGDQVLIALGQRMRSVVASSDFVARLGGDEFVLILQDIQSAEIITKVGERLIEKIGEPMHFDGYDCKVGASIGAAIYPVHGKTEDELVAASDRVMYEAKKSGKNRIVIAGN